MNPKNMQLLKNKKFITYNISSFNNRMPSFHRKFLINLNLFESFNKEFTLEHKLVP